MDEMRFRKPEAGEVTFAQEFDDALIERLGEGYIEKDFQLFIATASALNLDAFKGKILGLVHCDEGQKGFAVLFADGSVMTYATSEEAEAELREKAKKRFDYEHMRRLTRDLFAVAGLNLDEIVREAAERSKEGKE